MAIGRDLCLRLKEIEQYKTLQDEKTCPIEYDEARDYLINKIHYTMMDQMSKVCGIDLRGIPANQDYFPPEVEEKFESLCETKNPWFLYHILDFNAALDKNVKKHLPALYETYHIINRNAIIL